MITKAALQWVIPLVLLSTRTAAETAANGDLAGRLAQRAVEANPALAAIKTRIQALEQRTQQAGAWIDPVAAVEYSNLPVDTWAGYRVRSKAGADPGTDFFSLGLSVPIPLSYDRRWRGQQRELDGMARASEQQRLAELDQIRGALGQALARWRRATQMFKTYRTRLRPQAHRTLDATFAAYQVDRADFASLFQSELQLLDFERTIRRAEAQAAINRVQVEALIGKDLNP